MTQYSLMTTTETPANYLQMLILILSISVKSISGPFEPCSCTACSYDLLPINAVSKLGSSFRLNHPKSCGDSKRLTVRLINVNHEFHAFVYVREVLSSPSSAVSSVVICVAIQVSFLSLSALSLFCTFLPL